MRLLIGPTLIVLSSIPLFGYFYVGPDLASARYLYFATFGWGLIVAELLSVMPAKHAAVSAVAIISLLAGLVLVLNLRPWHQASDLVATVTIALKRGESLDMAVMEWQSRTGARLEMRNGLPHAIDGVPILANGYAEFRRQNGLD